MWSCGISTHENQSSFLSAGYHCHKDKKTKGIRLTISVKKYLESFPFPSHSHLPLKGRGTEWVPWYLCPKELVVLHEFTYFYRMREIWDKFSNQVKSLWIHLRKMLIGLTAKYTNQKCNPSAAKPIHILANKLKQWKTWGSYKCKEKAGKKPGYNMLILSTKI